MVAPWIRPCLPFSPTHHEDENVVVRIVQYLRNALRTSGLNYTEGNFQFCFFGRIRASKALATLEDASETAIPDLDINPPGNLAAQLRAGTYRPGRGAFYTVSIRVLAPKDGEQLGAYDVEYNHKERPHLGDRTPEDVDYAIEMCTYPRAMEFVPPWMAHRLMNIGLWPPPLWTTLDPGRNDRRGVEDNDDNDKIGEEGNGARARDDSDNSET